MKNWFMRWPLWARWSALAVVVILVAWGGWSIYNAQQSQAATTAAAPSLQTAVARTGNLTITASGTGTLIAANEVNLNFQTNGSVVSINVKLGDQVKQGDVLAQLDNTNQKIALAQAQQNLLELTSPAAIATAQQNVAADEQSVTNAQAAVNNLLYAHQNTAGVLNAQASMVVAQQNLDAAQQRYDQVPGDPTTSAQKASAYQQLYAAQLQYNSAAATYNSWTGTSNQATIDSAKATLALDKAKLVEDQTLVAALTGGTVPDNATGSGYVALQQAKLNVQTAQKNLDETTLVSPISGTVIAINGTVGQASGTSTFMTVADLSQSELQIYMDSSDWTNVKVGYPTNVVFDALPNDTFTGKVTEVTPQLVTIQGNSVIEGLVLLDKTQADTSTDPTTLPIGDTASVDVVAASARNVVLIPVQALHQLATNSYAVFVMQNGTPTLKVVTIGLQDATYVEIKTGVKAGDVVTTGIQQTTGSSGSSTGVSNP